MKVITIGRDAECDVVINDPAVSRTHIQIVVDERGRVSVIDLGSTNGTYVNGERITGERRLEKGDEVRIGHREVRWEEYVTGGGGGNRQPMMWVGIAIAAAVIVGLVVWLAMARSGKKEAVQDSIPPEREQEKAQRELQHELDKANIEYKDAMIRAATSKSEKDSLYADSLGRVVGETRSKLDSMQERNKKLEEQNKKTKDELSTADKKLKYAISQRDSAIRERDRAAKDVDSKEKELKYQVKELREAKRQATDSEKELKITKEFYEKIFMADDTMVKKLFKTLDGDERKENDRRRYVIKQFQQAESLEKKQKIVDELNKLVGSGKEAGEAKEDKNSKKK